MNNSNYIICFIFLFLFSSSSCQNNYKSKANSLENELLQVFENTSSSVKLYDSKGNQFYSSSILNILNNKTIDISTHKNNKSILRMVEANTSYYTLIVGDLFLKVLIKNTTKIPAEVVYIKGHENHIFSMVAKYNDSGNSDSYAINYSYTESDWDNDVKKNVSKYSKYFSFTDSVSFEEIEDVRFTKLDENEKKDRLNFVNKIMRIIIIAVNENR